MSKCGYIKLYRKTLENPVVMKDADHLAIWCWLLMTVTKFPRDVLFDGGTITLQPGQWTTGRKIIASELHISESKVYRTLKLFESEQLIEQQTDRKCTLITIVNWDKYQESEQGTEQQVNNERTTSEQQVNTKQESKEREKVKKGKKDIYSRERIEIVNYLNELCGTSYRPDTKDTVKLINARLDEKFTVDDFKTVIYKKAKQWKDDAKMVKFLRPETLFGNKFEGYLNEKTVATGIDRWDIADEPSMDWSDLFG